MFARIPQRETHRAPRRGRLPRGCAGSPRPWPRSPAPCWPRRPSCRPPGRVNVIPPGGPGPGARQPRVVTAGGMPGWQITLIALGAALVAATAAVLLDRARAARRAASDTHR